VPEQCGRSLIERGRKLVMTNAFVVNIGRQGTGNLLTIVRSATEPLPEFTGNTCVAELPDRVAGDALQDEARMTAAPDQRTIVKRCSVFR
jgi:hypothetical protein